MVAPTGSRAQQIFKVQPPNSFAIIFDEKTRRWQKAPYSLPLDYDRSLGTYRQNPALFTGGYPGESGTDAATIWYNYYDLNVRNLARNAAYENFKNKTYDSAQLGVDFVEYSQSVDMISRSLGTLAKAVRQVRSKDFVGCARTLKQHFVPPKVSARRSWANNWLEYHFGWEPLVRDVYDSIEVLHNPLKAFCAVKGVGRQRVSTSVTTDMGSYVSSRHTNVEYTVAQGGVVRTISSQTLHTLDQFGVLNPLSLAWEVVPFSFVVDWFANVGQVLSSLSDFAGLTLDKTYTSYISRTYASGSNVWKSPGTSPNLTWSGQGTYFQRRGGLSSPSFSVKQVRLPSLTRATTAISLLLQQFRGR